MKSAHPIQDEVSAAEKGASIFSRSAQLLWPEPPSPRHRRRRAFALAMLALMDFIEWQLLIGLLATGIFFLLGGKT
jgi:hypothetical protein